MKEEFFDIVDEDGFVTGQALRNECHGNPELVHQAVHVLVFNSAGELLLQKRSSEKDIQPGKWDTSVGGHLDPGETFLIAAHREMQEELGLSGLPLTFLYRSKIRNRIESENIETYLTVTDNGISYDPVEVSEVRFWKRTEIETALGQEIFTPNFEDEWRMLNGFIRKYQYVTSDGVGLCTGDSIPDIWLRLKEDQ